jgi:hypothetical protein
MEAHSLDCVEPVIDQSDDQSDYQSDDQSDKSREILPDQIVQIYADDDNPRKIKIASDSFECDFTPDKAIAAQRIEIMQNVSAAWYATYYKLLRAKVLVVHNSIFEMRNIAGTIVNRVDMISDDVESIIIICGDDICACPVYDDSIMLSTHSGNWIAVRACTLGFAHKGCATLILPSKLTTILCSREPHIVTVDVDVDIAACYDIYEISDAVSDGYRIEIRDDITDLIRESYVTITRCSIL